MIPLQAKATVDATVQHTIKAKPETAMTPEELSEYYNKLCALPPSTKRLVIIDNDTGEPSGFARGFDLPCVAARHQLQPFRRRTGHLMQSQEDG